MRKLILLVVVAAILATVLTVQVQADVPDPERVHVIIEAEDPLTEVELTVDGEWRGQMILDQGYTFLEYRTDDDPEVQVLAYGDTLQAEPKRGGTGDWYVVFKVRPPRDGDGGAL